MRRVRLHKINTDIKSDKIRLVGNGEPKVMPFFDAYKMAQGEGMDLILISENGEVPVVRMEEYNKFLYNLEKKEKEQKKKTTNNVTKEIKFSCEIQDHDLMTKSKKAIEFLGDGDKVKCTLQLKGRQNAMPERGELVMYKFAELVAELGLPEALPRKEGNKITMTIKPKPKK
jgi:translation initiation factor IF-3